MSSTATRWAERPDPTCALLDALEARRRDALAERQAERILRLLRTVPPPAGGRTQERLPMKHFYQTLGVGRDATPAEIRSAHRRLARQYHTDHAGGDRARFQAVQEAYETLIDPVRRREYDGLRATWLAEQGAMDCPGCGTPNRIRLRGVATRCAACKIPLTQDTAEGRVKRKALGALAEASELAQGLVETVVEESVHAAQDAVRAQFERMRARLHTRAGRKE